MSWVSCEVDCLLRSICSDSCFIASCEQGTVLSLNVATAANPTPHGDSIKPSVLCWSFQTSIFREAPGGCSWGLWLCKGSDPLRLLSLSEKFAR